MAGNHDNRIFEPMPFSRYRFFDGHSYMLSSHAADQMLAATDDAVRKAVALIESYRPNNPELVMAVRSMLSTEG